MSYQDAEQPLLSNQLDSEYSQPEALADSTGIASGVSSNYRAVARFVGCCVVATANGWHDGCIGALIPYLQLYYNVSDEKVALVFIGSFTGYIFASSLNVTLSTILGLGRLIVLGAFAQGLASLIIACRPPFLVVAISYSLAGFGVALQDAQFNGYIARLPDAARKLGIVHAIYGVGALSSPITATLLMQAKMSPPEFYFTNVAWCATAVTVLLIGFRFGRDSHPDGQSQTTSSEDIGIASLRTVISSRAVWATLLFVSLYTGSETVEAGWIVSFLRRERIGGTVSGYASAVFYSGLTSSRVLLLPLTAYLTEKKSVTLYTIIALCTQIMIWTLPDTIVNLIAIAACGFVMGPVYPVSVSLVTKATPRGYHPGALSLMACVGQFGSALFPFLVGALAEKYDIRVLQPVLVSMFLAMIMFWQLVPGPTESDVSLARPKPASADDVAGVDENVR